MSRGVTLHCSSIVYLAEQLSLLFIAAIVLLVPRLRAVYFAKPQASWTVAQPRNRDAFLDTAKAIAIIAVIIVHVGYFFFTEEPETIPETIRIANNLLRFAIPWFLIVTGAVLPRIISKRRYLAILIPYALATAIIGIAQHAGPSAILISLATGRASVPYYYIPVMIQCYLLYPFLLRVQDKQWFLPAAFAITLFSFLASGTWYIHGFPFVGPYLFFFCYGMALRPIILQRTPISRRDVFSWASIAALGAVFLVAVPVPAYNTSLFYGVALFRLFLAAEPHITSLSIARPLSRIGTVTLSIFLTHMFIVKWAYRLTGTLVVSDPLRYIIILTVALPASILAGYILWTIVLRLTSWFSAARGSAA